MFCCRLWVADLFLPSLSLAAGDGGTFSASLPPLGLTTELRLAIIGSCLQRGIDHLNRPSIPPFLLQTHNFSPSLSLSLSFSSLPCSISLRDLAAATLISMVNGVPSSVQTNSWINRRVQTLSSLFPAEMVENSNATRRKPRGREAEIERERRQGWSGTPNIRNAFQIFFSRSWFLFLFCLLCESLIWGTITKDVLTESDRRERRRKERKGARNWVRLQDDLKHGVRARPRYSGSRFIHMVGAVHIRLAL